ncbi:hypothetical protein ACA910_004074 [Epithemia clementina (nom. ined.)]
MSARLITQLRVKSYTQFVRLIGQLCFHVRAAYRSLCGKDVGFLSICHNLWKAYNRDGKLSCKDVEDTMFQRKAKALNLKPTIVFRAFQKADVHSQGWVERSKFGAFIQLIAYFPHLYQVFTSLDTDHDRHLTKSEFVQAATLSQLPNLEQVFDEITREHYLGYIVFDDFCWYMAEHHVQVHPPTIMTLAAEQERPQGAVALAASSVTFSFASSSSSSMASGKSP